MRYLMLLPLLLCAACGELDTSAGASGFADSNIGEPGRRTGQITTDGRIILNRELPPGSPRRVW